jgi:prevent-host-death family protein
MAMRIGLRDANQRFSRAIKAVKAGEEVVLTERGNPIAVIKPLAAQRRDPILTRWIQAGIVRVPAKRAPMPGWRPRVLRGTSLSQTIREERDAS